MGGVVGVVFIFAIRPRTFSQMIESGEFEMICFDSWR